MSRHEHFFHGTDADIPKGDSVLPARERGFKGGFKLTNTGRKSSQDLAFATTHEGTAWGFANASSVKHGGRARVYEVEPHPGMQPGLHNDKHPNWGTRPRHGTDNLHEYVAPSFKTIGTLDTKPGYQGTFPQLNWNQFATMYSVTDENHPPPSKQHADKYPPRQELIPKDFEHHPGQLEFPL